MWWTATGLVRWTLIGAFVGASMLLAKRRLSHWLPGLTRPALERRPVSRAEDIAIYAEHGPGWWTSRRYLVRGLQALVRPRMKWFGRMAGPWSGQRVLDLGCGGGFMAETIATAGADVIGVDPALPAIEAARDHAAERQLKISYEVGRAEAIPLSDASVDRVVCVDVFEHVDDLRQCCREIARVLKPGGLLLFDTVNRTALARWIIIGLYERILRVAPRGTHDPAKLIRPAELCHYLESAGLTCGRLAGLGPLGFNWRGDPVFSRWPVLAMNYMGTARRTR